MADDIVLKIAVEGESEAADALTKVGESASASFEETSKAAETAGVSIEEFGKLSEKTQQAYIDLSKRVAQSSEEIVASTKEVQQAAEGTASGAKEVGGGLDEMSQKSGVSSKDMRALGKIMRELGLGEAVGLALSFQKVASSFGVFGIAALGVAAAGGTVVKFIHDANEATKTLEELSKQTGQSVETLRTMERAFEFASVSAKSFQQTVQTLDQVIAEFKPRIGDLIQESAEKVIRAKAALEKAQVGEGLQGRTLALQSQQLVFQTQQLRLQGQQLAQNLSTIQQQFSVLSQTQSIETRRAGLAVQDAAANLRMLELKRALMRGQISQEEFDQASAQEEAKALDRSIAKAKIDLENAKLEKEQLAAKQAAQTDSLELQQRQLELAAQQLPLQMEQIKLQQESNQLARSQFEQLRGLDVADAARKLKEISANNLGPLVEQLIRMANGSREVLNPLTSLDTLMKAVQITATQFGTNLDGTSTNINKATTALRAMFEASTGLQRVRLDEVFKGMKLPEEVIKSLETASQKFDEAAAKARAVDEMLAGIGQRRQREEQAVREFVVEPAKGAWQWIVDAFNAGWQAIAGTINTATNVIREFVTTPAPNAWQWMVDSFDSVLQQIKEKWNVFKDSFSTPAPGGGGGGGGGSPGGESVSPTGFGAPAGASALGMPSGGGGGGGVSSFGFGGVSIGNNVRTMLSSMASVARGGLTLPSLSSSSAGGATHNVTINFPGLPEITGLRASSGVVEQLQRAASMAQVRSGGRKPSRYT